MSYAFTTVEQFMPFIMSHGNSSTHELINSRTVHIPVLIRETMEFLDPKPGEFFIDGTLGGGGHTASIIERMMPEGTLLALDWDSHSLARTQEMIEAKIKIQKSNIKTIWVNDNFANLPHILEAQGLPKANGLLLDLGFSSDQMDSMNKGFSFLRDEPLLMTYNDDATPVKDLLRELTEDELRTVIRTYGEERYAGRIARFIKKEGAKNPITTTKALAEVIARAVPGNYERGRIHPATRTFMALRIYANHELENLTRVLESLPRILVPGGRVGIISFHSIEDRIVKQHFADYEKVGMLTRITKKPVVPQPAEIIHNPRARSAKLRVAQLSS